jgi:hypothetical protein
LKQPLGVAGALLEKAYAATSGKIDILYETGLRVTPMARSERKAAWR